MRWERVEPTEPCASPDGHTYRDIWVGFSAMPYRVLCENCPQDYSIRVTEEET